MSRCRAWRSPRRRRRSAGGVPPRPARTVAGGRLRRRRARAGADRRASRGGADRLRGVRQRHLFAAVASGAGGRRGDRAAAAAICGSGPTMRGYCCGCCRMRCLDRLFLLFPDPWPKARHAKRRFVHPAMLPLLARVLKPGAEWRVASDDPTYQAWVGEVMAAQTCSMRRRRRPSGRRAGRRRATRRRRCARAGCRCTGRLSGAERHAPCRAHSAAPEPRSAHAATRRRASAAGRHPAARSP